MNRQPKQDERQANGDRTNDASGMTPVTSGPDGRRAAQLQVTGAGSGAAGAGVSAGAAAAGAPTDTGTTVV